jgi:DedD protein
LIGAVLLLGIGVIAFPLLFETEPRPIPVDLPIEIPNKDGAPPLAMPAATSSSAVAAASPPPMITEPAADPAAAASAPVPVTMAPPPPAPAASAAAPKPDDGARAQALLDAKPASAPAGETRYVVQIGAFAEDKTVREVRAKAEKAGLVTYIQVITPAAGKRTRVRIGPFPRREEADAAAAKARKAGLPASVIRL